MSEGVLRILLVEDNPDDADLLQEMLAQVREQLEITRVERLQQAEEHLKQGRHVDAILLDLGLPDSMGIATLERIACAASNLPIIVLTGLEDEALGTEAVRKGAQDYLVKGQTKARMLVRSIHHAIERKQMEAALRESESRFRNIFDHAAMGIAISDCAGRFVQCNAAYCGLTGYHQEELAAIEFPSLIHPEDRERNVAFIQKLLSGELPSFEIENRYVHKDTRLVWVHKYVSLLRDDRGQPAHIIALVTDMTERKQTEDVLRFLGQCGVSSSGEEFFRELARYLAKTIDMDFVCIDRLKEGLLSAETLAVFHNGQFEDNVSYTLKDTPCGEVVGRRICCFARNVRRLFPKDAVLQDMQAESYLGATLWSARGKPIGLIAVIGRRPLADTRLAQSIMQLAAVRAAGELERQQAEETLRQAKEDWERTFDTVPDLIAILDDRHRIMRVNLAMARALDAEPEKCVGQFCFRCVHGTDQPPQFCPHASTLVDGREHTAEVHEERLGGDFLVTTTPMLNATGELTGAVHIARDITAQKRAERVLRELNDTLEQKVAERTAVAEQRAKHLRCLAAELSQTEHREREQFAAILHDNLQQLLLAARLRLAGVGRGKEGALRKEVEGVDELIGECLSASRDLTMELSPPILHRGELGELFEWLGGWFGEKHGLTVTVDVQESLPSVPEAIRVFLFHSARELLLNAVKHSGKRKARVSLSSQDGCLTVQVEDSGSGFDPTVVQQNLSRARSFGLFNIQERLEALEGRLDIEATTRGGACFRLTVPAGP